MTVAGELRIGIVGCGWVAGLWLDHLVERPDVEVVGYVDTDRQHAEERCRAYGTGAVHPDLAHLLATPPDLVANLTPPEVHAPVTLAALRAGCHVLTEKPLGTSVAEAAAIVSEARRVGRTVAVMQNRRYSPGIREFRGYLGRREHPFLLTADMFVPWTYGGFRAEVDRPLLTDMAIHTLDQARFLVARRPIWAHCHELSFAGSWIAGHATAVATFEFDGGTVFDYRGSWGAPGAETSWNATWRAASTVGTILWDGESLPVVSGTEAEPALTPSSNVQAPPVTEGAEHGEAIDAMLDAIAAGRKPETDAADNLWSVAMLEAAMRSAQEGRRVALYELGVE